MTGPAAGKDIDRFFITHFWRYLIMKNMFTKNLVKSMTDYGEMLNRIGG